MGKKKAKSTEFDPANLPEQVFVSREQDGEDTYLNVHDELDGISNDTVLGVYELVRVGRVSVGTTLEDI